MVTTIMQIQVGTSLLVIVHVDLVLVSFIPSARSS